MRLNLTRLALAILAAVFMLSGCGPVANPTNGVAVQSKSCQQDPTVLSERKCRPGTELELIPYVPVWGDFSQPDYDQNGNLLTAGTVSSFGEPPIAPPDTGPGGMYTVVNAKSPAKWNLYYLEPYNCGESSGTTSAFLGEVYYDYGEYWDNYLWWEYETPNWDTPNYYGTNLAATLDCYTNGRLLPASTRFAILGSFPATLTLSSGAPLVTKYGMPLLYVYDKAGNLVSTLSATSVDTSNTEATFPFPSTLAQSGYSLAVVNQVGAGSGYAPAGVNLLSIAGSQTIQGNPFGVGAQYISTTWQSGDNSDPSGDGTCQGPWTYNSGTSGNGNPVVTQYSLNSVSNGSASIAVGSNPTAIALYGYQDTPAFQTNGPCHWRETDTTQMTRAIVANSGNNTVSILDLVNNAVLDTVTVGNQPVALAVSSDGGTAYVANYSDSTVTEVNLKTDTPVTTIAVAGQPTSIALTAGGVLWVGGVGFLAEIDAQNMNVVATQSTSGQTVSALGYTDTESELVATTMDTSGNVNIDEVSPASVRTNFPYTAVASHRVSSLGSYYSPRTQTMVRGFTSTLTQSTVPVNSNLAGAPPLVVQDGWAAVTATPTGFSITDTSGHVVLASETTPSPIAAIAVDTNLNIA